MIDVIEFIVIGGIGVGLFVGLYKWMRNDGI